LAASDPSDFWLRIKALASNVCNNSAGLTCRSSCATQSALQSAQTWQCPECGHSLSWSLNRSTQPKPGEPSICGHCAAFVILTDDLTLRGMDWPDWCMLTHAKKRNLVATRAGVLTRIRASRQ
jgi:hypothetical protein